MFVWAIAQKLYMTTASYCQGKLTLHGTSVLSGYFELFILCLETMALTLKMLSGPLFDNDNDNILFDHNMQIYTTDLQ